MNLLLGILTFLIAVFLLIIEGGPQSDEKNNRKFAIFLLKCIFVVILLLGFYEGYESGLVDNNHFKVIFGIIGLTITLAYCV
ncbi:MAG: hypothetical protein RR565_04945 [Erysipelothrix sp.]